MSSEPLNSKLLKAEALRLGFHACGAAPAEAVPPEVMHPYEQWLQRGGHAQMHYLQRHLALRADPRLLHPGTLTVVSLAISYNPGSQPTQPGLAWYAQGRDYHEVVRQRAAQLAQALVPGGNGTAWRVCVDTAPVMERYWAWRCGLGFIGRHTQLVVPRQGSAFFLAEVLFTHPADAYDRPLTPSYFQGLCGTCRRCLDACPTGAITAQGAPLLQADRCLSYLTIEHRGPLPTWARPHLSECFYGCDRCLRACPHLSAAQATPVSEFRPSPQLLAMTPADWQRLTPEQYRQLFSHSAVKRAKFQGLMRNLQIQGEEENKTT